MSTLARRALLTGLLGVLSVVGLVVLHRHPAGTGDPPDTVDGHWTSKYPPAAGRLTTIDHPIPGWKTIAWLSTNGAFCTATYSPVDRRQYVDCEPAAGTLSVDGPPALAGRPVPYVVATEAREDRQLFIGTLRGAASTVDVTVFGTTVTNRVVPLAGDGPTVGVYVAWLPVVGHGGFRSSDITDVVARDSTGAVIASI